jgi:hypothetical protein
MRNQIVQADADAIPTALASEIYADGRDALAFSHVYTKMRWASESDEYILFPIPSIQASQNVFWTQLRLTCSNEKGSMVDVCYTPPEGRGDGPTHYVSYPLQAGNRAWTPLTWALPAAPTIDQELNVCVTLSNRSRESRPEYVRLDLLGFADLYPKTKEIGLAASEKMEGGILGYYNYLRPEECVYLPLSGHIENAGLRILPPLWTYLEKKQPRAPTHDPHLHAWNEEGDLAVEADRGVTW